MGRPAGASVLCLFPIPWPEAMVCIFRTTAGYRQAGDLSSGFITAHKMTGAGLWSQVRLRSAAKPSPLPANPTPFFQPLTHNCPKPELCLCVWCPTLGTGCFHWKAGFTSLACCLVCKFAARLKRRAVPEAQVTLSLPSPRDVLPEVKGPLHRVLI